MLYAGIDVHKEFCQIHVMDQGGQDVRKARVDSNVKDILSFFDYLPDKAKVVIEACGIKDNIIDALTAHGFEVVVSNPLKNRLIAEAKVKTDKIDARILADLLRVNMISCVYYPPKDIRELRDLVRQREYVVHERTSCKNRIKRVLLRNGVCVPRDPLSKVGSAFLRRDGYPCAFQVHQLLDSIAHFDRQVKVLEQELKQVGSQIPQVRKLDTIRGIDVVNATAIWSEIGDLDRFATAKRLVGLAGLYPTTHQSGGSDRKGGIARCGSRILRTALVLATRTHIQKEGRLTAFYKKLATKKGGNRAVVATARKMLVSIFYMLKNDQAFIA